MFSLEQKNMQSSVVITQSKSPFGKDNIVSRVVRNTADDAAVINEMRAFTNLIKPFDAAPVISAFVQSIKSLISKGNAVHISGLGTFYIKASNAESAASEDGKKDLRRTAESALSFEVAFTPESSLNEAAEEIKVSLIKKAETEPVMQAVYNIDTMLSDGTLTSGKMAAITGKRLCVLGEGASDGTGIFIVPCSETGGYKEDKSDWVQVADKDIHDNTMTKVLFRVPKDLSGWCRLCICTKAPLSGSKRRQDILKKSRLAISGEIFSII